MKRLEELGISPAPWKYIGYHCHKNGECLHLGEVVNADLRKIIYDLEQPTARLIAAAPKLYQALCEAYLFIEQIAYAMNGLPLDVMQNQLKARAALAEAAGEEVSDD